MPRGGATFDGKRRPSLDKGGLQGGLGMGCPVGALKPVTTTS
jgi:hypothetical protein